jgi:polyisoprenoid-binding protein YceI
MKAKYVVLVPVMALLAMACTPKNADEAKTGEAKKSGEAYGVAYGVNEEASEVHWRGTKVGGEHNGTVSISGGEVTVSEGAVTGGNLTIDLTSIVNEDLQGDMNARLVGHLKSEDFFHTEEYPNAVFEFVSAEAISAEAPEGGIAPTHEITGNLTMRGVTKSISFPAAVSIDEKSVAVKTNEFSIDRTLWGVNFKSRTVFAEFKDDYISDMINLKFDVEFSE